MLHKKKDTKESNRPEVGFGALLGFQPEKDAKYAYKMGYDCGKNGADEINCHFAIFSSLTNTKQWEQGGIDARKAA